MIRIAARSARRCTSAASTIIRPAQAPAILPTLLPTRHFSNESGQQGQTQQAPRMKGESWMKSRAGAQAVAQLALGLEQHEDAFRTMWFSVNSHKAPLQDDEREVLAQVIDGMLAKYMQSYGLAAQLADERKEYVPADTMPHIEAYIGRLGQRTSKLVDECVALADKRLLPTAADGGDKAFYFWLKSELYRSRIMMSSTVSERKQYVALCEEALHQGLNDAKNAESGILERSYIMCKTGLIMLQLTQSRSETALTECLSTVVAARDSVNALTMGNEADVAKGHAAATALSRLLQIGSDVVEFISEKYRITPSDDSSESEESEDIIDELGDIVDSAAKEKVQESVRQLAAALADLDEWLQDQMGLDATGEEGVELNDAEEGSEDVAMADFVSQLSHEERERMLNALQKS